ncbi:hypothetical protein HETIRDRAFT_109233 [Heterobasidion irregulare TC 32-1]|uniref:Uncharacterized protein n=1 Tax=Heterobasidion irregulare (strain TC 32-1) TaxID=747525 RepID=W4KGD1_HETIT|nr:uncharacterized protein HETIRDRAFT_109233 [Heterobasidion irregulare TC 32-1]ETW84918.1 hypothetical protein HETIRDRAFT_109233 [Heterobasidion irregulare TC 32-1]
MTEARVSDMTRTHVMRPGADHGGVDRLYCPSRTGKLSARLGAARGQHRRRRSPPGSPTLFDSDDSARTRSRDLTEDRPRSERCLLLAAHAHRTVAPPRTRTPGTNHPSPVHDRAAPNLALVRRHPITGVQRGRDPPCPHVRRTMRPTPGVHRGTDRLLPSHRTLTSLRPDPAAARRSQKFGPWAQPRGRCHVLRAASLGQGRTGQGRFCGPARATFDVGMRPPRCRRLALDRPYLDLLAGPSVLGACPAARGGGSFFLLLLLRRRRRLAKRARARPLVRDGVLRLDRDRRPAGADAGAGPARLTLDAEHALSDVSSNSDIALSTVPPTVVSAHSTELHGRARRLVISSSANRRTHAPPWVASRPRRRVPAAQSAIPPTLVPGKSLAPANDRRECGRGSPSPSPPFC